MKKFFLSIVAIAALVALPGRAFAISENTVASVDIVPLLSISEIRALSFGKVNSGATEGTVTLTTANTRTTTGGVTLFGNDQTTASYTVSGNPNATYAITVPATDVTVSLSGVNLTVNTFQALSTSTASGTDGKLTAEGSDSFVVGAKLTLPAGTAVGRYTGTFDVGVAYN